MPSRRKLIQEERDPGEILDPIPMEVMPRPVPLHEEIQRFLLSPTGEELARIRGHETYEEAADDDFEEEEELYDVVSAHTYVDMVPEAEPPGDAIEEPNGPEKDDSNNQLDSDPSPEDTRAES